MPNMRAVMAALILAVGCGSADPPTAPNAAPTDSLPTATGVTAVWQRTGYAVTGTATLAIDNGVARLALSSDFSIGQTPGPFVYLNTTSNVNTGQPIRIGALKSRTGAQTYQFLVPAGVRYTHVLIWCDPFNVSMAQALLPTP